MTLNSYSSVFGLFFLSNPEIIKRMTLKINNSNQFLQSIPQKTMERSREGTYKLKPLQKKKKNSKTNAKPK